MKYDSCLSDQIGHMGLCKPEWPLLWFRVSCLQRASRTLSNDPSFCLGFPRVPSFVFLLEQLVMATVLCAMVLALLLQRPVLFVLLESHELCLGILI